STVSFGGRLVRVACTGCLSRALSSPLSRALSWAPVRLSRGLSSVRPAGDTGPAARCTEPCTEDCPDRCTEDCPERAAGPAGTAAGTDAGCPEFRRTAPRARPPPLVPERP